MINSATQDPSSEYLLYMQRRQLRDLANLTLAHDVGLAHYWQAKKAGQDENAVAHWQKVIANWAMVLESDEYWQDWCIERAKCYGKEIDAEAIAGVKKELSEKLVNRDLADASQTGATETAIHLEAAFDLETKAIQLLKQTAGLPSPAQTDIRLYCGPLLAQQLAIGAQVEAFFRRWPVSGQGESDSLRAILAYLQYVQKDNQESASGNYSVERQLRLCFSQLGIALIYLEREDPQRTLRYLAGLRCPACAPGADGQPDQPAVAGQLPARCRDDCTEFARLNPAYAVVPDGRGLVYRHAVELGAGAHLSLAYQALTEEPADAQAVLRHVRQTLDCGQLIRLDKALQEKLDDLLLGWAEGLANKQRWNEAITLLDGAGQLVEEERRKVKLAWLLNARGFQRANEEKRWADAVADLRRACYLNPYDKLYRQNLENALYAYADAMYQAGNDDRARDLLAEAGRLGETAPARPPPGPPPAPLPAAEARPAPAALILTEAERVNPALFDERGRLKPDVCDASGQAVFARARDETASAHQMVIRIPALVLALAQCDGGETTRLLSAQGISSQQLQDLARRAACSVADPEQLRATTTLSQFNLWFSVLRVLDLAWEIAQYDHGLIGEPHILYGLLASRSATKLLQEAGVNVSQMITQAGWR